MAGRTDAALPLPQFANVRLQVQAQHRMLATVPRPPRVAEFFAGIGLVRLGLEAAGLSVVWANDLSAIKQKLYVGQFSENHFQLKDVRAVTGAEIPDIELATASFPCTDLSLAGYRRGLAGEHSGLFWEFLRVLREMGERRPQAILIENVIGFLTSHGGDDLRVALVALNELGYWCDILTIDARHFVPQSRPRLFIIASRDRLHKVQGWSASAARSEAAVRFAREHALPRAGQPALLLQARAVELPARGTRTLADVVERFSADDPHWWDAARVQAFLEQLSPLQRTRLDRLGARGERSWATMYRRTRAGRPAWEIRDDQLSGCLRAVSGGSSRQALVEAGAGQVRVRWMTAREYARLQGAADYRIDTVTENQALFGFGDAVCVPAITWLAEQYLVPLLAGTLTARPAELLAAQ